MPDPARSSFHAVQRALAKARDPKGQCGTIFTKLYAAQAEQAADASDRRRAAGALRSPIDGLILSVKDLFDMTGEPTLAGAKALADEPAAAKDALVIDRLKAAGGIILGKTNMTQFALSCLGLNPDFGTPLSPWERAARRIAGGSSSGAAASVADGLVDVAIGTDTGGSIRVPAAFCGVVGFKPTVGRIDTRGSFTLSWTLDSIGPIARDVRSCAIVDAILANGPAPLAPRGEGVVLGVPEGFLLDTMDDLVAAAFDAVLNRLKRSDARLVPVSLPAIEDLGDIGKAGGGFGPSEGHAAHAALFARLGNRCDPRVMDRFAAASGVTLSNHCEMTRIRADIIARCDVEDGCDAIIFPSVPIIPPRLDDLVTDQAYYAANARAYRNAWVVNALDRCAISIPCGTAGGPPVGLTLMARTGRDAALLSLAEGLENVIKHRVGN